MDRRCNGRGKITESNTAKKVCRRDRCNTKNDKDGDGDGDQGRKADPYCGQVPECHGRGRCKLADKHDTDHLGDIMKQNRSVRTACGIREDIGTVWIPTSKVKYNNNEEGRSIARAPWLSISLIWNAVVRFRISSADDITVEAGTAINAVGSNRCSSACWQHGDCLHHSKFDVRRETDGKLYTASVIPSVDLKEKALSPAADRTVKCLRFRRSMRMSH